MEEHASASATLSQPTRGRPRGAIAPACAALALLAGLSGCGSGDAPPEHLYRYGAAAPAPCTQTIVSTLGSVARKVYAEANGGRIALQALFRLESSPALRRAVERDDAAAAKHELQVLAESQIVRSSVVTQAGTLADVGDADAIAPVSGVLRNARGAEIASLRVSVLGANGYVATLIGLIGSSGAVTSGAQQLGTTLHGAPKLRIPASGTVSYKGVTYHVLTLPAKAYSGAPARVSLLFPTPSASVCGSDAAQTRANTLGAVAELIYRGERSGGKTIEALHTAESSIPFREAVASGNRHATRQAILEFFKNRSHVVRVRVYRNGKLFIDVGGHHVLAPASGTLRVNGRVVGTFQLAIQDDMGYMLLAHNFTGAQVLMRTSAGQVMGTLRPGPATIPDRGELTYEGVRYQAFSFDGEAFPSGQLRISLLIEPA